MIVISNITRIIMDISINHLGLTSGSVPLIFKYSLITPIIKKPFLDPSSFNNYRSILNRSVIIK